MDSSAAVQSGPKNHFIEHKQAYTAAAVTVLALAVIAVVTGILGLLATEGVSLGFLSSLNGLGSVGSMSMLSTGGALTLLAATALGLLTTVKKGGTTPPPTTDTDKSDEVSSITRETESTTLVREKLTDQDDEELTPFLYRGEYIEFQARTFQDDEDKFTHQARELKNDQKDGDSLIVFTEEDLNDYTKYKCVNLVTLRERRAQFNERVNNKLSKVELLKRLDDMKKAEYYFCADLNVSETSQEDIVIGILIYKEDHQEIDPESSDEKFTSTYIRKYSDIRDDFPDYTPVSAEELERRANSTEE